MHIKKLEICGFKSFVDRTVIHFDHDMIGVVGPNGCGKSNVVDSIRWVMGEQSAKALRGKAMGDVIFNGSETRPQAGFAEVTITFDNTDLESFDGMPAPEGEANLKLVGANALIDKLIGMGLVSEDDAMGARMMMGMFTVSAGDDTVTSKIEVNDEGHVLANGQRLK